MAVEPNSAEHNSRDCCAAVVVLVFTDWCSMRRVHFCICPKT